MGFIMDDLSAISILEEACGYKLSSEQKECILKHSTRPTLINACAGSGKTSVMILSIIFDALTKKIMPDKVLCMTFSKRAQQEMIKRYQELRFRIVKKHSDILVGYWQEPQFSTFDSFFYSRLRRLVNYSTANVINNVRKYYLEIEKKIPYWIRNDQMSLNDDTHLIFDIYNTLINNGFSTDGLCVNLKNHKISELLKGYENKSIDNLISEITTRSLDDNFVKRYKLVITEYQKLKRMDNVIDFTDMKVKLYQEINGKNNEEILSSVSKYKEIFIDEFQDIDYLQWQLIKKLFPEIYRENLIAVGDDDQSIYGFRGSDPYYITHFDSDLVSNAQILHLSTNYRTGGKILKSCIPMIEKNQTRLAKTLKTSNPNSGLCYGDYSTKRIFQDQRFFKKLFFEVKHTDKTIAILVRYNIQKQLIADILTESNISFNTGNGKKYDESSKIPKSLQDNIVYKVYLNLMKAFFEDDSEEYVRYSKWIGFKEYHNFLERIRSATYENLNSLLKISLKSDFLKQEKDAKEIEEYVKYSLFIIDYVKLQKKRKEHEFDLIHFFEYVNELLSTGLCYRLKKHIISRAEYNTIKDHLSLKMCYYHSFTEFIKDEKDKASRWHQFFNQRQQGRINLLTIHQAKGMEFNEVFLYGENEVNVMPGWLLLNYDFPSNMSYKDFKTKVNTSLSSSKNYLTLSNIMIDCGDWNIAEICEGFRSDNPKVIEETLHKAYQSIIQISGQVEEERRLLYVAITRAKDMLCINYTEKDTPLLEELDQFYIKGISHLDAQNKI